ncbi:MAG: hydrogenase maturation nickel metallochaperone HypA [Burkholderiales bacterium]|nr:hydrogenase maturation nickel metallochaperone HypA [Burkholderiales bacterium]
MALVKCKECGKEFSSSARACPNCGKRRTSFVTKLFAGFFILVGVFTVWGMIQGQKASDAAAEREAARLAALNPAQRAAEEAAKAREQRLSAARGACLIALKSVLHDPDSAKLESTSRWYVEERKDGTILVQPSGRAKNAFGAYINGVVSDRHIGATS